MKKIIVKDIKFLKTILSFVKLQALGSMFLSAFIVCSFSYAQTNTFNDETRAKYICSFIRQITWQENATKLTMGVLESDTRFSAEMRRQATTENLRDKTLTLVSLKTLENLPNLHILYVNKSKHSEVNIEQLTNIAKEKGFLLITEAAVFHQSMINFVSIGAKTYYEVNEQSLQKAGLTYMSTLPYGAIKNKEEWVALFKELDELKAEYEHLTKVTEAANLEIEKLKLMITDNVEEIISLDIKIEEKIVEIDILDKKFKNHLSVLWMRLIVAVLAVIFVALLLWFGLYEYRNRKRKKEVNKLFEEQNKKITEQNDIIKQQERAISDSISSASLIQKALLPKHKILYNNVNMFVFYRPLDVVSGDFYWMTKKDDKLIIAAADCTGHGVPGAFMTMLGISLLNEIVNKENPVLANEVLNKLRDSVISSLSPENEQTVIDINEIENIDIALCVIDYPNMTLQYAGAFNPLYLIRDNELTEIKADRMHITYSDFTGKKAFTNILISLQPNDCIYIFSDGYADQFGGSELKKFTTKRLKAELLKVSHLSISEQEEIMVKKHDDWKGNIGQLDDVLLIGIKI